MSTKQVSTLVCDICERTTDPLNSQKNDLQCNNRQLGVIDLCLDCVNHSTDTQLRQAIMRVMLLTYD